jgi:hypothetical protein
LTRYVKVRATKRFNEYEVGDIFYAPMNPPLAHLIVDHYLELMEDPGWQRFDSARSPSVQSLDE